MPDTAELELAAERSLSPAAYAERLERAIKAGIDVRAARDALEPVHFAPAVHVKALGENDGHPDGTVEAVVSVFGNVDSYGDRMLGGAFVDTLKAPPEGRGLPPVVWSHAWSVPPVGASDETREIGGDEANEIAGKELNIDGGLYARYRLFVAEGEDHAVARQVWVAMRTLGGDGLPPLREHSFGFRTVKSRFVEDETEPNAWFGEVREIEQVELFEIGPTLVGANDRTVLLSAKSRLGALHRELKSRARGEHQAVDRKSVVAALSRSRHSRPGGIPR